MRSWWDARRLRAAGAPSAPFGINTAIAAAGVSLATLLAGAVSPVASPWRLGLLVGALAVAGWLTRDVAALLLVGVVAFSLFDGFLENRLGELSWHGGDLGRLAVLVASGVLGALLGRVVAAMGERKRRKRRFAALEAHANASTGGVVRPPALEARP